MQIIRHRVNSIAELESLPLLWGAEIDLRSRGNEIVLQHDPFRDGENFRDFIATWARRKQQGILILNPKEDGLESVAIEALKAAGIGRFFFLDLSLPTTVRLAIKEGVRQVAVRVSEYETLESAQCFTGRVEWAWIDCFSGRPPDSDLLRQLRKSFKVCLVSPELHAYSRDAIARFLPLVPECDAVCTKFPESWGSGA